MAFDDLCKRLFISILNEASKQIAIRMLMLNFNL